ncbi:hypothetical protein ABD68_06375 [Bacillus endophyticus]|uniref:DUF4365 domain-containing protein n=1 Tax=Priestia endophytica TaxID=135735 RepID=UPI0018CE6A70|nr:DUF4365 domain-containing protein [Priestia endophytica]MBG9811238.1 hypothetical protein [Priestia endophytica]
MILANGKKERLAVAAITNEANKPSSFLIPEIPVGDKGISFDGEIQVFKDSSETKESFLGKVPVQSKGTEVNEFSNGTRSFSLELEHYRNYYNDGGVLLFVVEILETGDTKIFYKQLLPLELYEIIKYYGHQGTKSVELRALSESSLYEVCKQFLRERTKQPAALIENNTLFKESEFNSYDITSLTFNPDEKAANNIFEHDFTLYGFKETLPIPLHNGRIQSIGKSGPDSIKIDGKMYTFNMNIISESSRTIFSIEEALSMKLLNDRQGNNLTFKIDRFHSLSTQLKIIPFLIELLNAKNIEFPTNSAIITKNTPNKEKLISEFKQMYSTLQKLGTIFKTLNISEDLQIGDKDGEFRTMFNFAESLVSAILEQQPQRLNIGETNHVKFLNISFKEVKFLLFYDPFSEKKLVNAFSKEVAKRHVSVGRKDSENRWFSHSIYILLGENSLAHDANLNINVIKEAFDEFEIFGNRDILGITNNFCLRCLKAFDLSKNLQLLDLVDYIYSRFKLGPDEHLQNSSLIIAINKMQSSLRRNQQLSDEEFEELMSLKSKYQSDTAAQFCINVLLENKKEADFHFTRMETEKQNFYKTLPIYHIYKNLI